MIEGSWLGDSARRLFASSLDSRSAAARACFMADMVRTVPHWQWKKGNPSLLNLKLVKHSAQVRELVEVDMAITVTSSLQYKLHSDGTSLNIASLINEFYWKGN